MKIVLHICCGVCAAGVVERLTSEGHEVFGFFYNPNIHPQDRRAGKRRVRTPAESETAGDDATLVVTGVATALVAGAIAMGGAAWYARRRWGR